MPLLRSRMCARPIAIFGACPYKDAGDKQKRAHNSQAEPRFYFIARLRAVKVLLAPLRSTLTVLAPRRQFVIGSRWRSSCSLSDRHLATGGKKSAEVPGRFLLSLFRDPLLGSAVLPLPQSNDPTGFCAGLLYGAQREFSALACAAALTDSQRWLRNARLLRADRTE